MSPVFFLLLSQLRIFEHTNYLASWLNGAVAFFQKLLYKNEMLNTHFLLQISYTNSVF